MNITLLYGPGEVAKRQKLSQIKSTFPADGISVLDFKQNSPGQIKNTLLAGSLFADKRLVVLENAADSFDLSEILVSDPTVTLVVVGGAVSATKPLLKSAQTVKAQLLNFDGEKEVSAFPFLDAVIERKKEAFVELEKLTEEFGEIYILTMLFYLYRRNILPLPSSSFAQKKIIEQKKKYQLKDWQQMYKKTLETEYKIKSGLVDPRIGLSKLLSDYFAQSLS